MIRNKEVNILRYLPEFVAKDKTFKAVADIESAEHETIRIGIQDLLNQMFVDTATWGLTAWERVFQTSPPPNANYAVRRSMLKAKMLGLGTMTRKQMEILINQFVDNHDAYVVENVKPGCFQIVLPSNVTWVSAMRDAVEEMKPAHLAYCILYTIFGELIEKVEVREQFKAEISFSMRDEVQWRGKRLDGSWTLCDVSRLDAAWSLDGRRRLDHRISSPPGVYLDSNVDRLGVLNIGLAGMVEQMTAAVKLNGRQRLEGEFLLGLNAAPLDDGGELEIRRLHRLDGAWRLDGGNKNILDGSIPLDGRATLYARGNRLAVQTYTDRLDGGLALTAIKKLSPSYLLHPNFTDTVEAKETLSIVITRTVKIYERAETAFSLGGNWRLDGELLLGQNDIAIDRGGEVETATAKRLDGTWAIDGGDVNRMDGTTVLNGALNLDGGGNRIEVKRNNEQL